MPRRAPPPAAVAPVDTLIAPPPPSPLILKLRQDYRWASISQFCFMFSDAFGSVDWDIEKLEADFDGDETQIIPELLVKLLFALTYNRMINRENVMDHIRKQYEKRERPCQLGTSEEPIEWATLGLGNKVQLVYELCEIQMEDPARFRGLLKTEEDASSWRIEPVGWDKAGNTYFLFDDNRLWIQRTLPKPPAPPRPPKKSSIKAKKALKRQRVSTTTQQPSTSSKPSKAKKSRPSIKREETPGTPEPKMEEPVSGQRRRTQVAFYGNPTPTVQALKRGANTVATPSTSRSTRSTRGHPLDSKNDEVLDTPVKGLAKGKTKAETPASLPRGTRVSRRFRDTEDEWQQVPADWLGNGNGPEADSSGAQQSSSSRSTRGRTNGKTAKPSKADGDDESELSELTDEEEHDAEVKASGLDSTQGSAVKSKAEDAMDVDIPETNGHSPASSALSEPDEEEHPSTSTIDNKVSLKSDETDADFKPPSDKLTPPPDSSTPSDEIESEAKAEDEDNEEDAEEGEDDGAEAEDEIKLAVKEAASLPEDFIEWEAVCVTLYDWRTFPEQFAKSRDLDEKALYKLLTEEVGPTIIEALVIRAQEKAKEEAVMNRKRSSRIATIQLEREEIVRRETAQREMEERMAKTQKEESRKDKEEAEMARREIARNERLKEREERAQAREEAIQAKAREEAERLDRAERERQERARRREAGLPQERSVSATAPGDDGQDQAEGWELNCEVCKKTGWNLDDDEDTVACEDCGRWQHTGCHDLQDMREGRRKRKWDKVDFRCQECLAKLAKKQPTAPMPMSYQSTPDRSVHPPGGTVPLSNGSSAPRTVHHAQQPSNAQPGREYRPLPSPSHQRPPTPHMAPYPGPQGQYPAGPMYAQSPYLPQPSPGGPGHPSHSAPMRPPMGAYHGPPPPHQSPGPYPGSPQYPPSPYGPPPHHHSPGLAPHQQSPHRSSQPPLPSPPSHPGQTPPHYQHQLPSPYPPQQGGQYQRSPQHPPYPPQAPYHPGGAGYQQQTHPHPHQQYGQYQPQPHQSHQHHPQQHQQQPMHPQQRQQIPVRPSQQGHEQAGPPRQYPPPPHGAPPISQPAQHLQQNGHSQASRADYPAAPAQVARPRSSPGNGGPALPSAQVGHLPPATSRPPAQNSTQQGETPRLAPSAVSTVSERQ